VSEEKNFTVDDAYVIKTPADSVRLYGEWADTYDSSVDVAKGKITNPELVEVNLYSPQTSNLEHASDKALIVVCQIM